MPEAKFVRGVKCCHCAGNINDHYCLLLLRNRCFFLRVLPTLSCHRSNKVSVACEGCGVAETGCTSWEQRKGEELLVLHSSVPGRALSPPFSISLQVIFRKDCLYSMAWQRGGEEAGFLRAAAAMTFLAIIDTPNSSSVTSAKQQRFGVIGSERKANLFYSVYFMERSWNWWFKPHVWPVTVVELCGKGPQALVPTCG